ncbi:hypothetical protein K438DRAFT_1964325 [Mycena galopus ATCC 62051]|nr:hypothetical protein K438DRAFT_1964325 [Mycena galopus ATCC 62051]
MNEQRTEKLQQLLAVIHDEDQMRTLLLDSSVADLFWLGIEHTNIWALVVHTLKSSVAIHNVISAPSPCPFFSQIPPEMLAEITRHLTLLDLKAFASTCQFLTATCASLLAQHFRILFWKFSLEWETFRCMLIHTGSLVTGYFAHHCLFLDNNLRNCRKLVIYVKGARRFDGVVRFVTNATPYQQIGADEPDNHPFIRESQRFRIGSSESDRMDIIVHRCKGQPECDIFRAASTANFVWLSGTQLFVAYPNFSFSNQAMLSPNRFRGGMASNQRKIYTVIETAHSHGITIVPAHASHPRSCGESPECPATLRNTLDTHSFSLDYSISSQLGAVHLAQRVGVSWTLGSRQCAPAFTGVPFFATPFRPDFEKRIDGTKEKRIKWDVEIERYNDLPPGSPEWTRLFDQMDIYYLFFISLRNGAVCFAVADYVSRHGSHTSIKVLSVQVTDRFNRFPVEVQEEILEWLPLADRVSFGRTSSNNQTICGVLFRRCILDLLRPYDLTYNLVRFLQIVTGIALSGSAVAWLATYVRNARSSWLPNDLDFYVPRRSWRFVLRFLTIGTRYCHIRISGAGYAGIPSIRRIAWINTHVDSPFTLNLMECLDENVYIPPTQFHSTCVVGCVTANSAWFGNLNLTSVGISIMNRSSFRMLTTAEMRRALSVIRKWQDRGFTFVITLEDRHVCGRDLRCPATLRVSHDAACTLVRLPYPARRGPKLALPHPIHSPFAWHQGGQDCYETQANRWGTSVIYTQRTPEEERWLFTASMLLDMPRSATI